MTIPRSQNFYPVILQDTEYNFINSMIAAFHQQKLHSQVINLLDLEIKKLYFMQQYRTSSSLKALG